MLDTDTKRRIDTARDILVGKVPDPKSQVEQITIALIYKFMDDMDLESEELGGKRKFFADGFSRYGWAKLMHSGLGSHETLNLYAEAITRMPENPGIPPLFRNIFKNAYKQLRRMLLEDALVAVVSLPAGVFQPYSGVKTSILILDKAPAKQSDTIAFFKVEHDGFNLGAQRRPIDKNDLPQVRAELGEYLQRLRGRESLEDFKPALGLVVPREKVAENGEYSLSGERYLFEQGCY